jgi:multisubunit Na+/H+ antiporter MnhF subunit
LQEFLIHEGWMAQARVGAVVFSLIMALAIGLATFRLIRGPSVGDRMVALDLVAALWMVLFMTFGIYYGHEAYLSAALALAVVTFLATVVVSKYLDEGEGEE